MDVSTMCVPYEFDAEHIKSTSSESMVGSVARERPFTYKKWRTVPKRVVYWFSKKITLCFLFKKILP